MRAAVLVVSSLLWAMCAVRGSELVQPLTPASLAALYPNGIPERPAMFGIPQYTASITGLVVYATPNDRDACKPLERTVDWPTDGSAVIVMVDRGNCTFVTKVRNVENIGGAAAIIVDNVDESNLPYMADDGYGESIRIPSVLIHKTDGQNIKDALNTTLHPTGDTTVLMKMTWNLPHPDNHVEWEFWTSSWDPSSVSFKNVFGAAVVALGSAASMTPHYSLLSGGPLGCTTSSQSCGNQCTNHGRYCNVDPDHNVAVGLSGANLVEEDLRQICLARVLNATGQDNLWWDYVRRFNVECNSTTSWNATCSTNIINAIGVNAQLVSDCVVASNGTVDNKPNKLFDSELALKSAEGIFFVPTLVINGAQYRGSLYCPEPLDIATCGPLDAICAGYADGTQPQACLSSPGCALGVQRDPCGICGGNGAVDLCGLCMPVTSSLFNRTCAGCDGIPWSGAAFDACGVCKGDGSFDACSRCLPADDPQRIDKGGFDVCGHCLAYSNPLFNNSGCIGCDGKPFSNKEFDPCGECGGDGSFDACGRCFPAGDPHRIDAGDCTTSSSGSFPVAATVGIVIASVVVVGGGVFFYMKRQQTRMRDDIDSLLRQYLPLEAANDMAHSGGRTQDQHRLVPGGDGSVNRTDSASQ